MKKLLVRFIEEEPYGDIVKNQICVAEIDLGTIRSSFPLYTIYVKNERHTVSSSRFEVLDAALAKILYND